MSIQFDNALHVMEVQGGSFVKSLAHCYCMAAQPNRAILRQAFAKYFDEYERRFAMYSAPNAKHTIAEDFEHFKAYTNSVPAEERLRLAYEHGDYRGRGAKDEWQTIETAPTDGTRFLAYHPTFVHNIWVTFWRDTGPSRFTHWMPLPEAPTNLNGPRGHEGLT